MEQAGILYDLTEFVRNPTRTGIQHVCFELLCHWNGTLPLIPACLGKVGQLQVQTPELAVVAENNVQGGYAGGGNRDADPLRDTRRQSFPISRLTYDSTTGQSRLSVEALTPAPSLLPGRVARVGDRWGVVDSVAAGELVAWGDLRAAGAATFELLGSYLPLTPGP